MVPMVVPGDRFFWNLSANVGISSANQPADVQLVQLGYVCAALDTQTYDAATRALFAAVVPGAIYTGQESDPLTQAIRAHEKIRGTQDGHVSVMRGSGGARYDSTNTFLIVRLNTQLRLQLPGKFPRLDMHPKCPPLVRAAVENACRA
jgi:hypothetical protein